MSGNIDVKRAILAKIEGTYGTDSTPSGGSNAMLVKNLQVVPLEAQYASREGIALPAMGRFSSKTANVMASVSFDVEMTGANAAGTAPPYGCLLRACNLSETIVANTSVTYAPHSNQAASEGVSIYAHTDGMRQKILGWRGSVAAVFANEDIPVFRFRGMGFYSTPTDTALPSLTLTPWQAPLPMNRTNTPTIGVHSYAAGLWNATFDLGNQVNFVPFPGTNGSNQFMIVDRRPVGSVELELPTIAEKDYFSIVASGATGSTSIVHGTAAGNIVTITAAQSRLTNPRYGNQRGVKTLQMDLELAPSNSLNDEISIAFT